MPPASFIHPATVFPQRMTNTPGEKMESTATRPHTHTHTCAKLFPDIETAVKKKSAD